MREYYINNAEHLLQEHDRLTQKVRELQKELEAAGKNNTQLQRELANAEMEADDVRDDLEMLRQEYADVNEVLAHLKGPGPHTRGCWVVDGILGKE